VQRSAPVPEPDSAGPPAPEQVDRLLGSKTRGSRVGIVSVIDLGDQDAGTTQRERIAVFNLDYDQAARVHVELAGPTSLQLADAPTGPLRPAREGNDPTQAIELQFSPAAPGRVTGRLSVTLMWPDGTHEEKAVEVRAAAHHYDEPSLDEQDAVRARVTQESAARAEEARKNAALDAQIKAQDRAPDLHVAPGHLHALDERTGELAAAWKDFYESRATGVTAVRDEITGYKRKPTPADEVSLAVKLALAAIDVATGGLSDALGKAIEKELEHSGRETLAAVISGGVKEGIKYGSDTAKEHVKPDSRADAAEAQDAGNEVTADPQAAFINTEINAVSGEKNLESLQVAQRAASALIPMLRRDPDRALGMMDTATKAVMGQHQQAQVTQAIATRSHWLQYLAHTSGGAVPAPGATESVTDPEVMLSAKTRASGFDGVVDVFFTADIARAENRVTVTGVRVHGVKRGLANSLLARPLNEQPVPVRAIGKPDTVNAELPVTVVRDESGSVRFEDGTGPAGQSSDWLSRHAGEQHVSPGGQLRGARKVMDEIAGHALNKTPALETDDESTR